MRQLIYAINLTLDGCCDHTKGNPDADLHDFHRQLILDSDTFLYGRKTYELMVPFWPDLARSGTGAPSDVLEFARAFDQVKEILVFSRTLKDPGYSKTRICQGDLRQEVEALKSQDGKPILTGGVDIPAQLIGLGLVDEFHFVIQPTLVGAGRRLFEEVKLQEELQLIDTRSFASGTVALHYQKKV